MKRAFDRKAKLRIKRSPFRAMTLPCWFAVIVVLVIGGCRSDEPTSPGGGPVDVPIPDTAEILSEETVETLDTAQVIIQQETEIVLPNGLTVDEFLDILGSKTADIMGEKDELDLGPQDAKNYLIARMAQRAIELTTRSLWVKPDEGPNRPAQPNGLAYVYGGKTTAERMNSATGCCPELYGLDCSGFVAQLFAHPGVTIPVGPASQQRKASVLTPALKSVEEYEKLYAEDLGPLPHTEMESGDIIYWQDSGGHTRHIGIVLGGAIYQSNGSSGMSGGACNDEQCTKNFGPTRGPRPIKLSQVLTFFSSSGYSLGGVVRIIAELSGEWRFHLRCSDQPTDALTADLHFPTTEDNSWELNQGFNDYDGSPLSGTFEFSYAKLQNHLTCTFSISGNCDENPFRIETFDVRLNRDDTGYIGTTELFRNECAGCLASIRLVNLERPGQFTPRSVILSTPETNCELGTFLR